ncbi:vitronectin a [Platichthys flesus]|uniref:vitronectin a n=1 Tax=Platichthys flesus TaxID=8260 RepID=UPI002DB723FE|nr:vitronectin a [Platichthys flesus]
MRLQVVLLVLLAHPFAAEESCMDRCENGFDSERKCQCDSMCKYYRSCCSDFEVTCGMMTRGDTFSSPEDADEDEVLEGTTSSPGRSTQSFTTAGHQLKPTRPPISDFRPQLSPESTLDMTKPPRLMDTMFQRVPVRQQTPASNTVLPKQKVSLTTEPPNIDTTTQMTTVPVTTRTTAAPDPDAEVCSGRPFDSFMQLKNGSIFAFRGDYFFELNQQSVVPGYPKLIRDVWGIDGPIDAAFTRINCQGKTYFFKGNKYWRFDSGVLEEDYPRDISVGFDKIPDHVDAAFSLPASGHHGRERVYFFKADQYYMYEFLHQPSHGECITMSESSPSTVFRRYTDIYSDVYESFFSDLFSDLPQHHSNHHFIDKDWKGLKSPVDAAMAGRIYVTPLTSSRRDRYGQDRQWDQQYRQQWDQQYRQQWDQQNRQQWDQQYRQQWDQQNRRQWGRGRQSRSTGWGSMAEQGMNMGQDSAAKGMEMGLKLAERRMEMEERLGRGRDRGWEQEGDRYQQNNRRNSDSRSERGHLERARTIPIQSVFFFKGDKYYRVDLSTKRVDPAVPPYPRSIAQYWLGCSKTSRSEK